MEEIIGEDGIDGFVGPYDLPGSLGRRGEFEHPNVIEKNSVFQCV